MDYRTLGSEANGTALKVSSVGLGCMGMSHAYGAPLDEKDAIELIAQAVDEGCIFFDTAECYGTQDDPHANEVLVGRALAPYRDKVKIVTKFGIRFDLNDGKVNHGLIPDARPEVIRASVEGSLKRLGTDYLDLYFQHRQDPTVPVEEVAGVMSDLAAEGKILHWGLSEVDEDAIRRAHAVCPVTAIENRYSMMARYHESLFPVLEELGIGFVAFSPMANGLLAGKYTAASSFNEAGDYRAVMPQFQQDAYEKNQALLDLVAKVGAEHNAADAQISLAWMLCKKPYIVPIPGTRKRNRLTENLGAADVSLTAEEVASIDAALDAMDTSDAFGGSAVKAR